MNAKRMTDNGKEESRMGKKKVTCFILRNHMIYFEECEYLVRRKYLYNE